ncbi:hypothetical protein FHW00_004193 [Ochrobactrum sp. P6BSIII]|nr:hypothetical protein [Ochrobactrum sp. P6BSIII]
MTIARGVSSLMGDNRNRIDRFGLLTDSQGSFHFSMFAKLL